MCQTNKEMGSHIANLTGNWPMPTVIFTPGSELINALWQYCRACYGAVWNLDAIFVSFPTVKYVATIVILNDIGTQGAEW